MTFQSDLGVTGILCSFRLVKEDEEGNEIPESLRLEFLETLSVSNFALSDAENNPHGTADMFYFQFS